MLVVENDVVLYQSVFKFPLIIKQMLIIGILHPKPSPEVMGLSNRQLAGSTPSSTARRLQIKSKSDLTLIIELSAAFKALLTLA